MSTFAKKDPPPPKGRPKVSVQRVT